MTSSSTKRADEYSEYISLNNGTKDDSDSKIDGGHTVTSSSSPPPWSVTPPPYTRIVLMTFDSTGGTGDGDDIGRVADSLPPSLLQLQQTHVTLEEWRDLWSRVQPKLDAMKGLTQKSAATRRIAYLVLFLLSLLPFIFVQEPFGNMFVMLYYSILFCVTCATVGSSTERWQTKHFKSLQTLFRDEEERVFRRKGVVIDCEFEWWGRNKSGNDVISAFVVYVLPLEYTHTNESHRKDGDTNNNNNNTSSRNGYLRIQLDADDRSFCGDVRNSVSALHLESHRTLPTAFSTNDLATTHLWDRFWSRLMEQPPPDLAVTTSLRWVSTLCFLSSLVLCIITLDCLGVLIVLRNRPMQTYKRIQQQRLEVVREYLPAFARLGLWVELRCLRKTGGGGRVGGGAHTLYVLALRHVEAPTGIATSV